MSLGGGHLKNSFILLSCRRSCPVSYITIDWICWQDDVAAHTGASLERIQKWGFKGGKSVIWVVPVRSIEFFCSFCFLSMNLSEVLGGMAFWLCFVVTARCSSDGCDVSQTISTPYHPIYLPFFGCRQSTTLAFSCFPKRQKLGRQDNSPQGMWRATALSGSWRGLYLCLNPRAAGHTVSALEQCSWDMFRQF